MNTDELIAACKIRAGLPATATGWTNTQIINGLNEDQWTYLVPKLVMTNGEFYLDKIDALISGGQSAYPLPHRVSAGAVRVVKYVDSNGQEATPLAYIEVPDTGRYNITTGNAPLAFYFTGTELNLLPVPAIGTTGGIRMYYHRRPGALTQNTLDALGHSSAVALVQSVTVNTITTQAPHSGFMSNQLLDIVSHSSPYRLLGMDVQAVSCAVGSSLITTDGGEDLTTLGIGVGDTVTLAETSWYPQGAPLEWHSLLELATGARILGSLGDLDGQRELLQQAELLLQRLNSVTEFRSAGNSRKINAWR